MGVAPALSHRDRRATSPTAPSGSTTAPGACDPKRQPRSGAARPPTRPEVRTAGLFKSRSRSPSRSCCWSCRTVCRFAVLRDAAVGIACSVAAQRMKPAHRSPGTKPSARRPKTRRRSPRCASSCSTCARSWDARTASSQCSSDSSPVTPDGNSRPSSLPARLGARTCRTCRAARAWAGARVRELEAPLDERDREILALRDSLRQTIRERNKSA
jgi:hypothetical protein